MGLSCEIPTETMSLCIHGVPIKFECVKCMENKNIECIKFYNEQRLKELESQIKALIEMYKDLICRVAGFSDHLIKQIDENRKISRRLDDIVGMFAKDSCKLESEIIRLDKKFDDLEKLFYDEKEKFRSNDKKPYKCPVCEGNGCMNKYLNEEKKLIAFKICNSCEGKGIIWG